MIKSLEFSLNSSSNGNNRYCKENCPHKNNNTEFTNTESYSSFSLFKLMFYEGIKADKK